MRERKGDWMQTFTGKQFYPADPHSDDYDINDVAHALSQLCRYGGHTSRFYSVAEHSILMSEVAEELFGLEGAYEALMHDGSEAYLPDIPKPVKNSFPAIDKAAQAIEKDFNRFFCIPFPMSPEIKDIDTRIVVDEKQALMNTHGNVKWHKYNDVWPLGVDIRCLSPVEAEAIFLKRFRRLVNELKARKAS